MLLGGRRRVGAREAVRNSVKLQRKFHIPFYSEQVSYYLMEAVLCKRRRGNGVDI